MTGDAAFAVSTGSQITKQFFCFFFLGGLREVQDLCLDGALSEEQLKNISLFHFVGCLDRLSVHEHTTRIAGLVRNRAALNQPRDFQKLVNPHFRR